MNKLLKFTITTNNQLKLLDTQRLLVRAVHLGFVLYVNTKQRNSFTFFVNSDAPEFRDYNVLSQPNRHQSFGRGTNSDSNLVPGWYRFQSSSYSRMVDNCIQVHRCKTDITGWLKGGHPTFKDGIVDREACFHGWENCCYRIVQIRVRECQGFYVYELNPSPEGRYRYCARG